MTSIHERLPAPGLGDAALRDEFQSHDSFALPLVASEALKATPTVNDLPFQRGGFTSLCEALDYAAQGATGLNFFDGRAKLQHVLSYNQLARDAQAFARQLIDAGFARGERLVIIADTSPGFCVAFFGAQYAGIVPVPVSTPVGLGSRTAYIEQLKRHVAAADAIAILAPSDLVAFARTAADGGSARFAGTMADFQALPMGAAVSPPLPLQGGEACYVQFSSGSTRDPQGIDIRQDQLMANIDASLAAQEICSSDAGVSWLPLYHDMGLIGFVLAPMCAQRSIDLLSPHDFARRPLQWLSMIARRRATITYSPSFGYDLVVRRAKTQDTIGLDLSSLRLAGIGADMIRPAVLDRFGDAFATAGFDRQAFLPSYGMAEVCVGLSFSSPSGGMKVDSFPDPQTGHLRDFVVCGRVIAGHTVEIRDTSGRAVNERQIGRLFVQGPSVMPGYFRSASHDASLLQDQWLDTGDLGYWRGDELVITGRAKDLIIVNGRNVWPQDIEWAVEKISQVRLGSSCAFSVSEAEAERAVVLVESRPEAESARRTLERELYQTVMEAVSLDARIVLIGRRPGLPHTSSGKLARSRARDMFLAGAYA